jgi:hypothetical protein
MDQSPSSAKAAVADRGNAHLNQIIASALALADGGVLEAAWLGRRSRLRVDPKRASMRRQRSAQER